MAPAGPDSVNALGDGGLDDEVDIGVVVGVLATRNLDKRVGKADELRVGVEVLGGRHGDELDGALVTELHVRPLAHGKDRLGRSHAVVGDQDLADRKVAAALFHKLGYSVINLDLALRSG